MTLPSVEETDAVVAEHDPEWSGLYTREAGRVEAVFGPRCRAIEHIGSTAVPALLAKPIVDILVASIDDAVPSSAVQQALAALGYVFLGQDDRRLERWFWRKRGHLSFNLSVVPFMGQLWRENLLVRNYLRHHSLEVRQYAEIKRQAAAASPDSLLGYQDYKRAFMVGLKERASEWRRQTG